MKLLGTEIIKKLVCNTTVWKKTYVVLEWKNVLYIKFDFTIYCFFMVKIYNIAVFPQCTIYTISTLQFP